MTKAEQARIVAWRLKILQHAVIQILVDAFLAAQPGNTGLAFLFKHPVRSACC
jgi:hypothetical protein